MYHHKIIHGASYLNHYLKWSHLDEVCLSSGNFTNFLPGIALKIELIDISEWNFEEIFIILFSQSLFKMVTFGWNLSEIWWFFEIKKDFKKGVPPNNLENCKSLSFRSNKLFRYLLVTNILQVTACLYLL